MARFLLLLLAAMLYIGSGSAFAAPVEVKGFSGFSWIGPKRKWTYRRIDASQGPVIDGKYSERFEIRAADCGTTLGYSDCAHDREHIGWNETGSTPLGRPVYYSISFLLEDGYPVSLGPVNCILFEFRPVGPGQINLSVELQQEGLVAVVGAVKQKQTNDRKPPQPAAYQRLALPIAGKWYHLEIEAVWSRSKDGKLRVYLDKKLVFSFDGPNTAFARPVHMQYGIYRPFVSKSKGKVPTQVIYYDRIRKASSREGLDKVSQ